MRFLIVTRQLPWLSLQVLGLPLQGLLRHLLQAHANNTGVASSWQENHANAMIHVESLMTVAPTTALYVEAQVLLLLLHRLHLVDSVSRVLWDLLVAQIQTVHHTLDAFVVHLLVTARVLTKPLANVPKLHRS